jgi:hypothetical protein
MNRKSTPLIAALTFAAAPLAMGQTYSCSIMYPLTLPNGSASESIEDVTANQAVGVVGGPSGTDAFLWSTTGPVNLSPTNSPESNSVAVGTGGAQQVGDGLVPGDGGFHAFLWTGTANSVVDLNPTDLGNVSQSQAYATTGAQQVGYAYIITGTNPRFETGNYHAVLWTGTANSAVDLNPTDLSGITTSFAYGTDGSQQVGDGNANGFFGEPGAALLWSGTAASAVNLSPTNLSQILVSEAIGVSGSQQVGYGEVAGQGERYHALLWTGTAASAVDLNTTDVGTPYSEALATNGVQQVGFGYSINSATDAFENLQALLWTDTAASAVDLETFLPSNDSWTSSSADSIDSNGNVFGYAIDSNNNYFAVEWSPVPEPTMDTVLLTIAAGLLLRRRRNLA